MAYRDGNFKQIFLHTYLKLKEGRIDLWIIDEQVAAYIARQAGDEPASVLIRALKLDNFSSGHYMAFSRHTPDAQVERVRKALETLRQNGQLDAIYRKWGLNAAK